MNKDVIYIEPEDDITDIITKIEKAKEKIVALVPPKKAGVFRSIVNIKLIAKAGATAEKTVVLVTMDPSITKLAAATKLPVAKNLQSAPAIPEVETEDEPDEQTIEDMPDAEEDEDVTEDTEDAPEVEQRSSKSEKASKKAVEADEEDEELLDEEEEEKPLKKAKKGQKGPKLTENKFLDWFKLHKKLSITSGVLLVALIGFLVWAFAFAPAVDVTVAIKTDSKNFSEGITFTDSLSSEDAKTGKFYLEQKKIEEAQEVEFTATGEKNQGKKASGELVVYTYFKEQGSAAINAGAVFSYNGLNYVATENTSLSWDGQEDSACDNAGQTSSLVRSGCQISGRVKVEAANAGTSYNVGASTSGWSTIANVSGVYSDKAMSGGTDKIITVVQQSDIESAKNQLTSAKEEENKEKLYKTIGDDYLIIESTFEQNTSSATSTPAADEEVKDGVKPKLTATTTISVYVINRNKLMEFVEAKAALEEGQKVYDVKDIYIENFTNNGASSTAKLKAQYYIGPKITETEVVDKIKGKGLGDAQREIRDLYGVSDVKMNTSYPWVMAVPGDSNKVTVRFEVKDQDGNAVQEKSAENNNSDSNGGKNSNSEDKK